MVLRPRHAAAPLAVALFSVLSLPDTQQASAMEFVCQIDNGGASQLGAHDRSIVVISRDADGGGCRFSVDGFPSAGPSVWALDMIYENYVGSGESADLFVYDLLLRSLDDERPPVDLATLLLSAGGYGPSDRIVGYDTVQDFAATFLDDFEHCMSMMEYSGSDFAPLQHGFCGYMVAGGENAVSAVADALHERGISLPIQYDEGGVTFEQRYLVYGIDTGTASIAAFFPADHD
ncbi:MAG: hypothetical protein AAFX92_02700 [Pseudomonadota bacterium]